MIVSLTGSFRALRAKSVRLRLQDHALVIEYISRQRPSLRCTLCPAAMDREDLLCIRCFERLYPSQTFKTSRLVLHVQAVGPDCLGFAAEELRSLDQDTLHPDEWAIVHSMRQRMRRAAVRRCIALQHRARLDIINEQLDITRLRYLLCLKSLNIDEALVLKRHIVDLRRARDAIDFN